MSTIAIPFISHVEQKITPEQAMQIAQILGLPMELNFISLTIDENLNLRAFARGISESQPFHWNSVPFNYLAYQAPESPAPEPEIVPPSPPLPATDAQEVEIIPSNADVHLNMTNENKFSSDTTTAEDEITDVLCSRCGRVIKGQQIISDITKGVYCSSLCRIDDEVIFETHLNLIHDDLETLRQLRPGRFATEPPILDTMLNGEANE